MKNFIIDINKNIDSIKSIYQTMEQDKLVCQELGHAKLHAARNIKSDFLNGSVSFGDAEYLIKNCIDDLLIEYFGKLSA